MRSLQAMLLVGLIGGMIILGLLWGTQRESQAQGQSQNLRTLIDDLTTSGERMQFEFAEPIAPGFTYRESNGADMVVGEDYVCFTEPWNDGSRFLCTPFANIVSLTFTD